MSSFAPPSHDEFVVVRRDDRFGGFEEVKHKNENYLVSGSNMKFYRRSIKPNDHEDFSRAMEMQNQILANKTFCTSYPLYETPDGHKWLLISVVDDEEPSA